MKEYYNKDGIVIYNDDNIEVLRNLPSESINLIYCDILYNTGKIFDDYSDNLGTPMEALEWYRPRILEMKRVLTSNGSIFIHCNWRLDSYIRILMDEIFGGNCFKNRIYRKHSNHRGFFNTFDPQIDIVMYYVKNPADFVFNEITGSTFRSIPLFENGYLEARSTVRSFNGMSIDLGARNKHWLVSEEQLAKMAENGEIILDSEGLPFRYTNVEPIGNLWDDDEMLDPYDRTSTAEAYDTPKPLAMLEKILRICSNEGDTVADFFLGGGTTAVACRTLNRKGIFCDISEKACAITVQKLEKLNM